MNPKRLQELYLGSSYYLEENYQGDQSELTRLAGLLKEACDEITMLQGGAVHTRVVNITNPRHAQADIYIGRRNNRLGLPESIWANPYKIGPDGDRETVIEKYRAWLLRSPYLVLQIPELRGRNLGCYCIPEPCHGHVLAELADMTPPWVATLASIARAAFECQLHLNLNVGDERAFAMLQAISDLARASVLSFYEVDPNLEGIAER